MTKYLWLLVFAFCGVLAASGARAQDGGVTDAATSEPATEIHPATMRRAAQYRVRHIQLPDGTYWDMWGEREFRKVFNRDVNKVPIYSERREQGFLTKKIIGYKWELEETRDARAWGVDQARDASRQLRYWTREFGGTPPLWVSLTSDEMPFVYVNEDDRDVRSKDENLRATRVIAQLSESIYNVSVSHGRGLHSMRDVSASRLEGGVLVHVERPILTRNGYLNGEFILWPDAAIEVPIGHEGPVYRYIAIADMVPTVEQFVDALLQEKAQMEQWIYKRLHGSDRWERQVFPIQTRERSLARENVPKPATDAAPRAPAVEITHTLVLTNGDWIDGQLIEDTGAEIRFLVVVGGIAGERTYAKADVGRVVAK